MSPRTILVRDLLALALGIGLAIVLMVAGALQMGGAFSWIWFARAILVSAVVVIAIEIFILQRARRVTHVRGPLMSWRRVDQTQGCSIALLGALIALGLLACGGLMEWWLEWK